jgi:lysophospholipase L1-like esterase
VAYSRYVAIGDSQTEGLWDGDDSAGLVGFADRLAALVDTYYPGLQYANLAVRGRQVRDLLNDQLPQALSLQPDLVTVCIGMNDATRPDLSFDRALADLDLVYRQLADTGATIVTTTFPDIARILPVGRVVAARVARINDLIADAANRYDFRLVDLYTAPSMTEPDTWSPDRIHGSTRGHMLFAAAAAEAIGLPGSNHDWANPTGAGPSSVTELVRSQLLWTQHMFLPWAWRQLRGRSIGDGRVPRRPHLEAVRADPEWSVESAGRR